MLGALIGDIAGSRFEDSQRNIKTKDFELMTAAGGCRPTDDSIMTLAVAQALLECDGRGELLGAAAVKWMQKLGRRDPDAVYGRRFIDWIYSENPQPYNSFGNGSAMRVSPCAYAAGSLEEAKLLSHIVTAVTHNHPEGIKGAEATTVAVHMALHGSSIYEIRAFINDNYYPMNFTLDSIRAEYTFDVSCQGSVPQAIMAFLESVSFEDTIRNAISIGGDSDTIAAIAGSIAGAYYGIPAEIRRHALTFLRQDQLDILNAFESAYGSAKQS